MPAHGTSARPRSHGIIYGLLYAAALQWSLPSYAEVQPSRSEHRIAYRCMRDDVLTLTDVPCNGERVDIDLNRNVSVAQPIIASASREQVRTPKPPAEITPTAAQRRAREERCHRLRRQLGTLQSKLRRGYTTAAGIRLEDRKQELRAQAQSARCPST